MAIKNQVFWTNPKYKISPPLQKDIHCKYLVVGGGVAGVSTAYFLHDRGIKDIILVEKDVIGWGATGRAAGVLTPNVELDLKQLLDKFGHHKGLVFWYNVLHGMHRMKNIIKEKKIDCDYEEDPTLYAQMHYKTFSWVLEEYKVEKITHQKVRLLLGKELENYIHALLFEDAILSHQGASISPLKYTQNLAMYLKKKGVRMYEQTPVLKFAENVAFTKKAKIHFDKVIIATDSHPTVKGTYLNRATIAISQKLTKEQIDMMGFSHREMVWDSENDYHYFKLTKDGRLLIGYGDQKVKEKDRNKLSKRALHEIKSILEKQFPKVKLRLEYAWSASFGMTKQHVPMIRFSGNKVFVLGVSGQPIATMSAIYVVNRLLGKKTSLDLFFLNSSKVLPSG